jgi:ribosome-associated heat shock protein Hsp15
MSAIDEAARDGDQAQSRRLDKWLWFARIAKTRTTAAGLIEDGKVRLNRSKVSKPSQSVRAGDVLTVAIGPQVRVLKVLALGERRGPATEARVLYEDLAAHIGVTLQAAPNDVGRRPPGAGRPTKRDRRQTERIKGQ